MSDQGNTAVAHGGLKRQRDAANRRQEQRVEEVLAHTTLIVDAIAGVNTNFAASLNEERVQLARRVEQLQALHTSDQLKHSDQKARIVLQSLKSFRGAVSSAVKDRLVSSLRRQVDRGHAEVLDALTAHLDGALEDALAVADTQLAAERRLNAELVQQLQVYAQTLLQGTKTASQRAFQAEVAAMQKDVLLARLQARQLFSENRLVRHEQEVDALMRVVAQLAEKSHFAESARAELLKAKRHVRLLERHLDVNGVVAAVQAEVARAADGGPSALTTPPPLPPPPPHPSLRHNAPHYFALKMLEHKEVTLTELVDSWQAQESRLQEADERHARLEAVVEQVQHDALVVHQRYLEERQRREIAERRITDMVRERISSAADSGAVAEVQRLRWAYTEVVDDAAQLAVNLKVCRDELQSAQAEVARLAAQVRQLERDAETDQVALTIQELRCEYAGRVRGLEEAAVRTEMALTLARQVSSQYSTTAAEATAALRQVAQTNAGLTAEASRPLVPPASVATAAALQREVQAVGRQAEELLQLSSSIKNFGLEHGQLYEAQMSELMRQWSRVRAAQEEAQHSSLDETATLVRSAGTASRATEGASRGDDSSSGTRTLVASSVAADASAAQLGSVTHSSKLALREALMLLVASLQSTDVERSNLLDASLSDAQYVTELVAEMTAITAERDRLRAQVKVCRELLEKNHVTVVERALMHDVPVEDSLNVAEAAERITVLRDQLAAAKQLYDRSMAEVRTVTAEKEATEQRLGELVREHTVLRGHADRLAEQLTASMAKEAALLEKTVALQQQVTELVQPAAATAETDVDGNAEVPPQATPSQLSTLFSTLTDTLQRLDEEVHALRVAHSEGEAGPHSSDGVSQSGLATHGTAVDGGDAALLESLSRTGMMSVVQALKSALAKAGLLQASLHGASGAHAAALCDAADAAHCPAVPQPAAGVQEAAARYTTAQYETQLAQLVAERQQMHERLQQAEKTAGEKDAANQRLLVISKSLMEKQSALKAENERLHAQLTALTAAPAPAAAPQESLATAPMDTAAVDGPPPPSDSPEAVEVVAEAQETPTPETTAPPPPHEPEEHESEAGEGEGEAVGRASDNEENAESLAPHSELGAVETESPTSLPEQSEEALAGTDSAATEEQDTAAVHTDEESEEQ